MSVFPAADNGHGGLASVTAAEVEPDERPRLYLSPDLGSWLLELGGSLAFSTYQSSRLFFVSAGEDGKGSALERIVGSAMGLAVDQNKLWIANKEQVWRFSNVGPRKAETWTADAVYMPRRGYFLGPCDTHDLLADVTFRGEHHELLFVNTSFSCIAALDKHHNFRPVWKPDFISALGPGDRCHLNGMGARDGELAFATLCGRSDEPLGWKPMKSGGGMVIDIAANRVLCQGLSMPHSPRWHDGRLWLLNSGDGEFGWLDGDRFVPLGIYPGFARGLCFVDGLAVIGISRLRENTFSAGLSIKARMAERNMPEFCGLLVIDPADGRLVHWLRIEGPAVTELYDVSFIPGIRNPFTPGFSHPRLHHTFLNLPEVEGFPLARPALSGESASP
jgi:uncharacterized protein (TIGR03032 family)